MVDNDIAVELLQPERPRLSEWAYDEIRRYIVDGALPPGTRLVENKLTSSLGISRTPLREALHRLEQDGLIERNPGGGLSVTGLTLEELNEVMGIRAVLEGHCARLAAERISDAALADLFAAHEEAADAIRQGDLEALVIANTEFHDGINAAAHSPRCMTMINEMRESVLRYRTEALNEEATRKQSFDQHLEILMALKARDTELIEKLMRAHIDDVAQQLTAARTNRR
jgi:DNA-binding GntR family transcriptional regulator